MIDIRDQRYRSTEKVGGHARDKGKRRIEPERRNAYRADYTPPGTPVVDLRAEPKRNGPDLTRPDPAIGLDSVTTGAAPAPDAVHRPPPAAEPQAEEIGILQRLLEAAYRCNIDAAAELFNEALHYATDGLFRMARERVHILLTMVPSDAEARVMLIRIYQAEAAWDEARAEIERADQLGIVVPSDLRKAIEASWQAKRDAEESQRRSARERDESELRALRAEANRLRTENGQNVAQIAQLHREVRRWAWLTAAVSTLAIGFIAVTFTFSGEPSHEPAPMAKGMPTFSVPASTAPTGSAAASPGSEEPTDQPLAGSPEDVLLDQADAVLAADPDLDLLSAAVRGSEITLTGGVRGAEDLSRAVAALEALGATVRTEGVMIAALEFGTSHVVQEGDELIPLAIQYYGKSKYWRTIEADNDLEERALRTGDLITIPPIHRSTR